MTESILGRLRELRGPQSAEDAEASKSGKRRYHLTLDPGLVKIAEALEPDLSLSQIVNRALRTEVQPAPIDAVTSRMVGTLLAGAEVERKHYPELAASDFAMRQEIARSLAFFYHKVAEEAEATRT